MKKFILVSFLGLATPALQAQSPSLPTTLRDAILGADSLGAPVRDMATTGTTARRDLVENSAAAMSHTQPGVFFTINDSDNPPILYAMDSSGADRGAWRVTGATNIDWESASIGPCGVAGAPGRVQPGVPRCVYIGETGDNAAKYPNRAIYRVPEPRAAHAGFLGATPQAERLTYAYPDGPHDVEGMYVGPNGEIHLITKRPLKDRAGRLRPALVFRIPASAWAQTTPVVAELVDSLPIVPGSALARQVTDASLSPDARYVAVRTYSQVYVFAADAVSGRIDTRIAPTICNVNALHEAQGEGITWANDTGMFILTSEGKKAPIHMARCPLPISGPPSSTRSRGTGRIAFAMHGGAGVIVKGQMPPDMEAMIRADLALALSTGYAVLQRGGHALDAVEAAIRVLEDSPRFNAGKGAVITSAGTVELDAALMDGATLQAGSVASVQHIKNPITLAHLVMTHSPHVMLIGRGAEDFAMSQGMDTVPNSYFITERRWKQYEHWRDSVAGKLPRTSYNDPMSAIERKYGTVGAVALDQDGGLAAGTSTGGTSFKRWGRVGDSPIIGAGTYASNVSGCAVSATGTGEYFIRNTVAADICKRVEYLHESIDQAANHVIHQTLEAQHGDGGVIVMDRTGHSVRVFNTPGMYRGYIDANGKPVVELYQDSDTP